MTNPCKHGSWKDQPPCTKPLSSEQVVKDVLVKYEALERDLEELGAGSSVSISLIIPLENIEDQAVDKCPECDGPATHPSGLCRDCHQGKLESEEAQA